MKQIRESTRFFPSVRASVRLLKDSARECTTSTAEAGLSLRSRAWAEARPFQSYRRLGFAVGKSPP